MLKKFNLIIILSIIYSCSSSEKLDANEQLFYQETGQKFIDNVQNGEFDDLKTLFNKDMVEEKMGEATFRSIFQNFSLFLMNEFHDKVYLVYDSYSDVNENSKIAKVIKYKIVVKSEIRSYMTITFDVESKKIINLNFPKELGKYEPK